MTMTAGMQQKSATAVTATCTIHPQRRLFDGYDDVTARRSRVAYSRTLIIINSLACDDARRSHLACSAIVMGTLFKRPGSESETTHRPLKQFELDERLVGIRTTSSDNRAAPSREAARTRLQLFVVIFEPLFERLELPRPDVVVFVLKYHDDRPHFCIVRPRIHRRPVVRKILD
jgi:hypothetical protein